MPQSQSASFGVRVENDSPARIASPPNRQGRKQFDDDV
jgi:hypothetical protein